jgi:NADH:ubiquinone oxidoreductase subunit 5 (subunit L)/multisubunit Na+/H+ antiporter MnhA subunit
MLSPEPLLTVLGLTIVGAPFALFALLGLSCLLDRALPERVTSRLVSIAILIGLLASVGMLVLMSARGARHLTIEVGHWIVVPHYHFSLKLLFDMLSLPFVVLTFVLAGTIGAFANRYLHREPGFHRFYVLYAMFVTGMVTSALAGTIETLFTGWELVGLSSALLVAFYDERHTPVRNGLRVWAVYRVADAAFLAAAIILHHLRGEGDFDALLGTGAWPGDQAALSPAQALIVGLLLLVAAAGKSGLVPFSGWLPRAMEGPTPSSAVFYGALSVHLGAFLLLRVSPLISLSPALAAVIVVVGLSTAVLAATCARAQTDIKSALSFASLTQVGIIVAEIGLGLHWIALAHLIGHACLRTLQFVRAPMLLADYRNLENAIGARLPRPEAPRPGSPPQPARAWFYRFALERGYLDAWLNDYVARPFTAFFRWCDALERKWTDFLSGGESRESDHVKPSSGSLEEVL